MQRVALDLHDALVADPDVTFTPLVLQTSWDGIERKVAKFMFGLLRELPRRVRNGEADVVLFSSMVTATLTMLLGRTFRKHGVKAAAIVHGLDVTTPAFLHQRLVVPRTFAALDAVLPVSRATGDACTSRGLPTSKLHVVPNGIRPDRFPSIADRMTMQTELANAFPNVQRPKDGLLLCSVGRQVPRKGFTWFVENVMPTLPEDVHYWIGGAAGPDTENVQAAITRHGLTQRVQLLGRLSETQLAALYRGSDLFMMPNVPVPGDMEGFGVVMLEAGLCATPAIAAGIEGILDVITDGTNGHLVTSGDAQAFKDAILRYHHQPERLEALAQRTLGHIHQTFTWSAVARQYVETLKRI